MRLRRNERVGGQKMIKRKEDAKANREYTWEVMVIDTLDPIA